jgi:hypothetical protein
MSSLSSSRMNSVVETCRWNLGCLSEKYDLALTTIGYGISRVLMVLACSPCSSGAPSPRCSIMVLVAWSIEIGDGSFCATRDSGAVPRGVQRAEHIERNKKRAYKLRPAEAPLGGECTCGRHLFVMPAETDIWAAAGAPKGRDRLRPDGWVSVRTIRCVGIQSVAPCCIHRNSVI